MEGGLRVAVIGATGVVGRSLVMILEERLFPVRKLRVVASPRSAGSTIVFQDIPHEVEALDSFDFSAVDLCFFAAGGKISEKYVPQALEAGATVIDNSSCFRYQDDVPLVVPEVNGDILATTKSKLIANPNCSTAQMVVALKPFYDYVGINVIDVCTYQSVSGAGRGAIDTLARESAAILSNDMLPEGVFSKQIAFNVLPHIDVFGENGYTREEMKMVWETKKIFADENLRVNPTAVRVPVFFAHSEAIHLRTKKAVNMEQAVEWLKAQDGLALLDDIDYPTAVTHAASQDGVFVGRLRQNLGDDCGINMWVVADNIRKGAALNAIQIAERIFIAPQQMKF